ncbi:hypothetical protein MNBD_GAMMA23-1628 [hydrothermal vent metagenome]|uniref:Phospholipase/carboxylesterase/thioesterase domain-containing protein n=1 Tax=hydrothermal vent metagenome TaxID=652676 RepID=A0A3B1AFN8_9ZZZZ
MQILKTLEINVADACYSVIWLHGLGADGHDFEPIVAELDFKNKDKTRFIFPHAPTMPVTVNNGMVMPAWYDIVAPRIDAEQDEKGMRHSAMQIIQLIEAEIERGIASENIVLAGFSQGGAIALHAGLRFNKTLAGIMALSTYLPLDTFVSTEAAAANKDMAIFYAHGTQDPVIPISLAETSKEFLIQLGYKIDWHSYPMEHSVMPQEIDDISHWLNQILTN